MICKHPDSSGLCGALKPLCMHASWHSGLWLTDESSIDWCLRRQLQRTVQDSLPDLQGRTGTSERPYLWRVTCMYQRLTCDSSHQICAAMLHISSQQPVLVVNVFLDCLGGGILALHGQCGGERLVQDHLSSSRLSIADALAWHLQVGIRTQEGGWRRLWAHQCPPFCACADQIGAALPDSAGRTAGSCSSCFYLRSDYCIGFCPP